ncbi:hypothetical protein ACFX11_025462 [Malus domestica]
MSLFNLHQPQFQYPLQLLLIQHFWRWRYWSCWSINNRCLETSKDSSN